ncbi:MAG: protein kinase [Firmicutes bacterium]|nr:protein kinase [Bacillota bacterium]
MAQIIADTYEIIEQIGSGGGGVIYLAKHLRLNKNVVLKADRRKVTSRPELLRREVDALKDLSHSYIPQVYDFFVEEDTVYTVIDYVEGESLDKPLKRGERFEQAKVLKWAVQMLEALAYLHKPIHGEPPRGIVHSDIKPANIMLTRQGDIKLIDFNIALALGEENVVGLSAGYASPEHYGISYSSQNDYNGATGSNGKKNPFSIRNGDDTEEKGTLFTQQGDESTELETVGTEAEEPVEQVVMARSAQSSYSGSKRVVVPDARSDIYSLGATLYHLLSGRKPNKNAVDVVKLSDKEFSPLVVKIITKAMAPDPQMRYQSAEDMLRDIRHLRKDDPRRKKSRKAFILSSLFSTLVLGSGVFVSFVGLKRMQAEQKMLTLAEYSSTALKEGNTALAIDYALEALPEKKDIFTSEYTPQAIKALTDALNVYDLRDGYNISRNINLSSQTLGVDISPDGKTALAWCAYELTVFDPQTGKEIVLLPIERSAQAQALFVDNEKLLYPSEKGLTLYDIKERKNIWVGEPATLIALSKDKSTVAGVYKGENRAVIYDINGNKKRVIDFGSNSQTTGEYEFFTSPEGNLFTLSDEGSYLAVSFSNGGLMLYSSVSEEEDIIVYEESEFIYFEGCFNKNCLVYTAGENANFEIGSIDYVNVTQPLCLAIDGKTMVRTDGESVYLSNKNTIVEIDPMTGEQREAAFVDATVKEFDFDSKTTIVATEKNEYKFFDEHAELIESFEAGKVKCDLLAVAEDIAITAGKDSPVVTILNKKTFSENDVFYYDYDYDHSEARINANENKLMLFSYLGFRIYDKDKNIIADVEIPNNENVYDQQYSKKSGNLAVIYYDAFRLYSGEDGTLLYEKDGLKSVTYAKYGVSIFDGKEIKLIDIDSGKETESIPASGEFGAYCGSAITDSDLYGGKFIGSHKTSKGYVYAIEKDKKCMLYDEAKKLKFSVPIPEHTEAFFTENELITSPMHGTPCVYSLSTGKHIADLESDSYNTYVTELENNILTEYITSEQEQFAILLDKVTYEATAYLPAATDYGTASVYFDYKNGIIRKSKLYTTEELLSLGRKYK